jgi:hypothetical protein
VLIGEIKKRLFPLESDMKSEFINVGYLYGGYVPLKVSHASGDYKYTDVSVVSGTNTNNSLSLKNNLLLNMLETESEITIATTHNHEFSVLRIESGCVVDVGISVIFVISYGVANIFNDSHVVLKWNLCMTECNILVRRDWYDRFKNAFNCFISELQPLSQPLSSSFQLNGDITFSYDNGERRWCRI